MVRIRLNVMKGNVAAIVVVNDAEALKAFPKDKMSDFIKWVVKFRINKESYTEHDWEKLCDTFRVKTTDDLIRASRFATLLFWNGAEVSKSEVEQDLKSLGFDQARIDLIISLLEKVWEDSEDYLTRIRDEAIPTLTSLRWRVDVRCASSNYLKKRETVALLRIGTNDRDSEDTLYVELDEDKLSWLENVIGKIKREMIKARETPAN